LKKAGMTMGIAESCSGGMAASMITDVPGCSEVFLGSVVAYDNSVKIGQLGVAEETLNEHGAVSEPVAGMMAQGARAYLHADWGLATTGISGPTGGTEEKPVGLTYIAVAGPQATVVQEKHLIPHRLPHKAATAQSALNLLRLELMNYVG
ncbi:MAG: CinA family protein, partial [Candidatus Marinimicrobia bacterium]|nr:CinA family protein [Candidatus Neomarinimicrobiota bacterium]